MFRYIYIYIDAFPNYKCTKTKIGKREKARKSFRDREKFICVKMYNYVNQARLEREIERKKAKREYI